MISLRSVYRAVPSGLRQRLKVSVFTFESILLKRYSAQLIRTSWFQRIIVKRQRPLVGGQDSNVKRFIILAHPRTGSNLLNRSLSNNREILCNGEAFHIDESFIRFVKKREAFTTQCLQQLRNKYPQVFVDRVLFEPVNAENRTIGFKLFQSQFVDPRFHSVLKDLISQPDLVFILLRRENKLEEYLSLSRAKLTEQWTGETSQDKIHLDPAECEMAFKASERASRYFEVLVKNRKQISMTYEELCYDFNDTMDRVQRFLEVTPQPIRPALEKQRTRSTSDSISNYEALKEHFSETRWSIYFDE